jgi:hypothetical protein
MKKSRIQHLHSVGKFSKANLTVFAIIFAAIGGYFIYSSFAAGFSASLETENSTITSPATTVSDAQASGGRALKFQALGSNSCPLPAYPDATCTGVPTGTTLTTVSGDLSVSTDNSTVNAKDVSGCITINANNVTVQNSKARCVWVASGSATVKDTDIVGGNVDGAGHFGTCVGPANLTFLRVDIQGCENGAHIESNSTFQDSYIHDLFWATGAHTDGIQTGEGVFNFTVRHTTISAVDTSAINIFNDPGVQAHDILITDSKLRMENGSYVIYCPRVVGDGTARNIVITNNRLKKGVGYADQCIPGTHISTWSGNVDDITGASVAPE